MIRSVASLFVLLLIWTSLAWGQGGAVPPQVMPQAMPEAADPDTVLAEIQFPAGAVLPLTVTLKPDTLVLGQDALLTLEFPEGPLPQKPLDYLAGVEFSAPWLQWDGTAQLEASNTLVLPVKIYQINPFRVQAGTVATSVILVDLRTENLQETAAIRDPRRWGWNLWTLIVGGLLGAALILLGWWAWTARKVATETLSDWPVAAPAWMSLSIDLDKLGQDRVLAQGSSRDYLDRLAGICRRYIAGRFRVSAVEMTGPEIKQACALLGQPVPATQPFTNLLQELDSSRYNPEQPSAEFCRTKARALLAAVAKVRIMPRFTPVAAADLLAAEKSWTKLVMDLQLENPAVAAGSQSANREVKA